ncbi:tyrosine-type recombinase/integrase [Pectobacterium versatile]|uniref:Site-specific integrase n=3 Tax=Pectobacterium TaxID=122277 RepID=A0AAW3SYW7_9GAMM|nr:MULTISPECIES: site-specific integrase [Pectobacterium]MBA5204782.1 site-specific integrase [Pectobacterium aroidearum]MBN3176358.1 site-specific integrase [Pectobacterium parmentieri]MBQ4790858.1 tyrosine-type recombinase/integrase [Pectobacterium versatile]QHQ23445.1 tyrosine-type recombinase/integrase [Pectobacterium parvum]UEM39882.1 site-specific integrase [Pectobacterium aquaticum]
MKKRIKKILLSKALDKYFTTVSRHKRGQLQEFYRINVIKRSSLAGRYMDEVSSVDIASYRDDRLAQINPRTKKTISGNTVRLEMALLSALYNLAKVEWGTCTTNPVENVRKPTVSSGRTRRLTSQEERKITRYLKSKNPELLAIFRLAVETAMRQGEILSLRWEHIDLRLGIAHLPLTKNGSARDVPLSSKARQVLKEISELVRHECGSVFSYTSSGFKSAWRIALQTMSIEDLHFHDLRHEAISRFFELDTLNVMEIAAISGHKSMNMLKRYTHLRATHLVGKLDARKKQAQKLISIFIPYPADIEVHDGGKVTMTFSDFDDLVVTAPTYDDALRVASVELLRFQAIAAKNGERLPPPGHISVNMSERILISPL